MSYGADVPVNLAATLADGVAALHRDDPTLAMLLEREHDRQSHTLAMIAAASAADASVLACQATTVGNVTTEGYPGARYHAGCEVVDQIESLAVARAKALFGARYANVQPHSGSTANYAVLTGLLAPGDTLLGQDLRAGGHLTHGSAVALAGRYFHAVAYGTTANGLIDYDQVGELARRHRPRVIVCGASAYPRTIDFAVFRRIADEVGAYLLADISHIAGLVAAGVHPSPVNHAHVVTTSTYKQLYGPRGGLILIGLEADTAVGDRTLAQTMQSAVFPLMQGTPSMGAIAAKARALELACRAEFRTLTRRIVTNAAALAEAFTDRGYRLVTGGTDNHMVLVDVSPRGLTGAIAEKALESCGVLVNRNVIPGDSRPPRVASGVRFGTNSLALRNMGPADMYVCAALVDEVLNAVTPTSDSTYHLDPAARHWARAEVNRLCAEYPQPVVFGSSRTGVPS